MFCQLVPPHSPQERSPNITPCTTQQSGLSKFMIYTNHIIKFQGKQWHSLGIYGPAPAYDLSLIT